MLCLQVAYRGDNVSIPVYIENALMRLPAAVQYDITTSNGERPAYIVDNSTSGFLQWDLETGAEMELEVPIDWTLVDYETEVTIAWADKQADSLLDMQKLY